MLKNTAIVVVIHLLSESAAIIFTLPHNLASVFMAEESIISILQSELYQSYKVAEYLDSASSRIAQVPLFGDDISSIAATNISKHHLQTILGKLVGNPLHVYNMIARITQLLPHLTQEVEQLNTLVSYKGNNKYRDGTVLANGVKTKLPNIIDLERVAANIAWIQFVYRYDPVELSKGIIDGVPTEGRLSATDMMYIAGLCYKNKNFALAVEWAEVAQQVSPQGSMAYFISKVKVEHDLWWKSPDGMTYPNEEFFVHKFDGGVITGRTLRMKEEYYSLKGTDHIFYRLCREEKLDIGRIEGDNVVIGDINLCRLTNLGVPYLMLAPVRLEELSNNPILHIFHQVLSQNEVTLLKSLAYQKGFHTAVTGEKDNGDSFIENYNNIRIQAKVWLQDTGHSDLQKLSQKTGEITQLDCAKTQEQLTNKAYHFSSPAEPFQVGVYPPGGYYIVHHDGFFHHGETFVFKPADKDKIWSGNRIATLMYYLSDVKGGRTVFPNLGLSVAPEKGSAIFWFNLDGQGAKEERTVHGACPTTLGIKWVSNKWIREGSQIWRRPCTNITKRQAIFPWTRGYSLWQKIAILLHSDTK